MGDFYLPNRLEVSARESRLDMSLTALRLGQLTVGRLGYGQDVRLMLWEIRSSLASVMTTLTAGAGPVEH